jgi:hypothetical protein
MEIHVRDKGVFVVDDKTLELVGAYDEVPNEVLEIIEAVKGSKGEKPSFAAGEEGTPPKRRRGRPPKKSAGVIPEEDKPILVTGTKIEVDPSEEVIKQAIASGVV